jgi:hypothetical protein
MTFVMSLVNASVWYAITGSWFFAWVTWMLGYIGLTFIDVFCGDE